MKIYRLPQLAESNPGSSEYYLGPGEIETDALYLIYGRLRPRETGRKITTAEGAEEILCVIKGAIKVKCGNNSFTVTAGEAFLSKKAQTISLDNPGAEEAIYISAGSRPKAEEKKEKTAPAVEKSEDQGQGAVEHREEPPPSKIEEEDEYLIVADETLEGEAAEKKD